MITHNDMIYHAIPTQQVEDLLLDYFGTKDRQEIKKLLLKTTLFTQDGTYYLALDENTYFVIRYNEFEEPIMIDFVNNKNILKELKIK